MLFVVVLIVLVVLAVGSVKTLGLTRRRGEELTPEGTTHHDPDGHPRGKQLDD